MATAIAETTTTFDVETDRRAVAEAVALGRKVDPEIAARVRQRSDSARRVNEARMGIQEIGVQIIREMRRPYDDGIFSS